MKRTHRFQSILLAAVLVVGLFTVLDGTIAAQDGVNTAYVVVRFGDDETIVRAVTFDEPITAYRALELSGLAFTTSDSGWGLFLCSIEDVGDSSGACDNGDRYWSTHVWDGDAWTMRMEGIVDAMIEQDGHVEGFSWSEPEWEAVDPPSAPELVAAAAAASDATASPVADPAPSRLPGYLAFGVILLGLAGWLILRMRRRR